MIKLCIFDLDGTLIDSLDDLADAMNFALEKNGLPTHEREKYRFMVGSGISVLADRAMVVPSGTCAELKESVLADFSSYYRTHCTELTRPYDGIVQLLRELEARNVAAAVLSNKPDEFAGEIVEQLFPDYSFAAVWGKQDRFPRKPDPASVNAMLSMLGLQKDECLYIGDSDVDMLTAANAGLRKIGVSWGFRPVSELEQAGADSIAYSPSDILAKL